VKAGAQLLPNSCVTGYAEPLEASLPRLAQLESSDSLTVETLSGAVYQHRPDDPNIGPLHRFLAVISDLYRSFLDKDKRHNAGVPMTETLPPLAMFQNDGSNGPFTIPDDDVQQIIGSSVGVVSSCNE
jgi:hypothetical protein